MRVNATEYPKSLSWEMKSFSMPNIPRGTLGMKENLKTILEMVRNNISPSQRLIIEGSECKIDLGTACSLKTDEVVVKNPNRMGAFG